MMQFFASGLGNIAVKNTISESKTIHPVLLKMRVFIKKEHKTSLIKRPKLTKKLLLLS